MVGWFYINNREDSNENKKQLNINLSNDYSVKFLAQGEYNINFIIQDKDKKWVFRVNTASQLEIDNQIRYEYNALKTLFAKISYFPQE